MNVKGPGQPPAPGVSGPEARNQPDPSEKVGGSPGRAEAGKSFAEKVGGARPIEEAHVAAETRPGNLVVGDLAADLRAGKITAHAAVEKILERVVAREVGPSAPAGVREQIRAALQDAIETDPLLADKLRQLE